MAGTRKGCKKFLLRVAQSVLRILKALVTNVLVTYFLVSGLSYTIFGTVTFTTVSGIMDFLCSVPAQTLGCGRCSDVLLMCPKATCWQYAVNLTIVKSAKDSDSQYYDAFQEAALDTTCNELIQNADSPLSMVSNMIQRRARTGGANPTDACVQLHCQVMLNAVVKAQETDLSPPGPCTNAWKVKPHGSEDECSCQSLTLTWEVASSFGALCGSSAAALTPLSVLDRAITQKDACMRDSLQQTKASVPGLFQQMAAIDNCTALIYEGSTIADWFLHRKIKIDQNLAGTGYSMVTPEQCVAVMCSSFTYSLSGASCDWGSASSLFMTADLRHESPYGLSGEAWTEIDLLCSPFGVTLSSTCSLVNDCQNLTPCATLCNMSGSTSSGATERRLHQPSLGGTAGAAPKEWPLQGAPGGGHVAALAAPVAGLAGAGPARQPCGSDNSPGSPASCSTGGSTSRRHGGLWEAVAVVSEPPVLAEPLVPAPAPASASKAALSVSNSDSLAPLRRRLQDDASAASPTAAPASTADDDDLEDWTTSDWSRCTCLQQCTDGVRKRTVSCPAGMQCKKTKPPTAKSCWCWHCANCTVTYTLLITAIAYWSQGFLALMVSLLFYSIASFEEDDLSEIGYCTKCVGMFCKLLPLLIRLIAYLTLGTAVILFCQAFIPITDWMSDCKEEGTLRMLSIFMVIIWILHLVVGVYMRRHNPMPPWLHNSTREGPVKILCTPIRWIGP